MSIRDLCGKRNRNHLASKNLFAEGLSTTLLTGQLLEIVINVLNDLVVFQKSAELMYMFLGEYFRTFTYAVESTSNIFTFSSISLLLFGNILSSSNCHIQTQYSFSHNYWNLKILVCKSQAHHTFSSSLSKQYF